MTDKKLAPTVFAHEELTNLDDLHIKPLCDHAKEHSELWPVMELKAIARDAGCDLETIIRIGVESLETIKRMFPGPKDDYLYSISIPSPKNAKHLFRDKQLVSEIQTLFKKAFAKLNIEADSTEQSAIILYRLCNLHRYTLQSIQCNRLYFHSVISERCFNLRLI